jgi:hypothetical protein
MLNFGLKKLNLIKRRALISFKTSIIPNNKLKNNTSDFICSIRYHNSTKIISSSDNKGITGFLKRYLLENKVYIYQLKRNMTTSQANFKLIKTFENIIQSSQDKRQYRGLLLDNGLKCLLISDPFTDRSAAAVDVHAGYMLDPKEFPGLAHFCEHMLFMGSKKVYLK